MKSLHIYLNWWTHALQFFYILKFATCIASWRTAHIHHLLPTSRKSSILWGLFWQKDASTIERASGALSTPDYKLWGDWHENNHYTLATSDIAWYAWDISYISSMVLILHERQPKLRDVSHYVTGETTSTCMFAQYNYRANNIWIAMSIFLQCPYKYTMFCWHVYL